ncbi:MAG: tRNA pseudouridine(55) synthase TruB [Halofilum sp. (in: g-proteobacteria)]
MGRRKRRGRAVHGIVLLDKPAGMTSNAALQVVKRLYDAQKAGHTGSLDPLATGLLPVCLGEATKISAFLLDADKHYRFTVRLGERTDSGDADGELVERREPGPVDAATLEPVLARFMGEIEQVPPMHSALKRDGRPLYEYARRGEEVERASRPTVIHRLDLMGIDGHDVELSVHCAKGTYVRTLAEDIGEVLGCGGHVTALRRTGSGPFLAPAMVTLDALQRAFDETGHEGLDGLLTPTDQALADWPGLEVTSGLAAFLRQGQAVQIPKAPTEGVLRLYEAGGSFIGMGHVQDDGRVAPKRLMNQ